MTCSVWLTGGRGSMAVQTLLAQSTSLAFVSLFLPSFLPSLSLLLLYFKWILATHIPFKNHSVPDFTNSRATPFFSFS